MLNPTSVCMGPGKIPSFIFSVWEAVTLHLYTWHFAPSGMFWQIFVRETISPDQCIFLFVCTQGGGAAELCSMAEEVLFCVQNECQPNHRHVRPLCLQGLCTEGKPHISRLEINRNCCCLAQSTVLHSAWYKQWTLSLFSTTHVLQDVKL